MVPRESVRVDDWEQKYHEAKTESNKWERKYGGLVEVTASRIAQGEESKSPHPAYCKIPGTELEIVDIIRAKSKVATDCWQFHCWAEAVKHLWAYDLRGAPTADLTTTLVYLGWLKDSVKQ